MEAASYMMPEGRININQREVWPLPSAAGTQSLGCCNILPVGALAPGI